MAPASRTHRYHHENTAPPPPAASVDARRAPAPRPPPPPRWLTLVASLGILLQLSGQRGAQAQVYEWNGISVKQYGAQEVYESWQKDDETYASWAYRNVRSSAAHAARAG